MNNKTRLILAIGFVTFFVALAMNARGAPVGTQILANTTDTGPTISPALQVHPGGTINTLNLNVVQQYQQWKAYVGNITGSLTLDDSNNNTIYSWSLTVAETTGEVYASRSNAVTWSSINCSNSTHVLAEESALGITTTGADSIMKTFNDSIHPQVVVAGRTIPANLCNSTSTFINDTRQSQDVAYFPLIAMSDNSNFVYATIIKQNIPGFDQNRTYDYQMIVADNPTTTTNTYYFYAELG